VAVALSVLGPLEVAIGGTVSQPGRAQARRVLALLAAAEGRWVSSDVIELELWPEDLPKDPRSALHVAVNRTRSLFADAGHEIVVSAADGYRLACGAVDLDLMRWRALVAEAAALESAGDPEVAVVRLDRAQSLWRGEAFADVTGSERVDAARRSLARERDDVELRRVELLTAVGRVGEAAALGARLAEGDTVREDVVVAAMRALRCAGRTSDALRLGDRFRSTLRESLGIVPSHRLEDEERAALRLRTGDSRTSAPHRGPSDLTARRATAAEALAVSIREDGRAQREGRSIVVRAEPGGGRTTFLAAVVDRLREGDRPPMVIAVSGAAGTLRTIVPELPPTPDRPAELLRAVEDLRATIGPPGTVIVVDDAHLLDDWSRQLMVALRRHRPAGLMVVTSTLDPDEPDLGADDDIELVVLDPLDRTEVLDALHDRWPDMGRARALRWANAIHRWCGGNALWTDLAIAGLDADGEPAGFVVPASAATTIRRALAHLDDATRDLLRIAAVLGPGIDPELVATIAERPVIDALAMLSAAAGHGIVVRSTVPGRWRFRHDLVGSALAGTVDDATATSWRASAGLALAEIPGRRADAAALLVAAVPLVDRATALDTAVRAGDEMVEAGEHETAAALFTAALDLAGAAAPPGLRLRWADALDRAGRPEEAEQAYDDAMDRAADDDHATLAAAALGGGGHGGVVGGRSGRRRRLGLAFRRLPAEHPERGRVAAEYALELVNGRGAVDDDLLAVVDATAADDRQPGALMARRVRVSLDEVDRGADIDQVSDLAGAALAHRDDPVEAAAGLAVAVGVALTSGRWTMAEAWADELDRLGRRAGVARALWQAEAYRTTLLEGRGAVEDADASARRALELGRRLDIVDAEATFGLHVVGRAFRVGSLATVASMIAGAADRYHFAIWHLIAGLAELDAGREGPARDRLGRGVVDLRHERAHFRASSLALGALLAVRLDDREVADELAKTLATGSWRFAVIGYGGPCVGPTAWYQALVATALDRIDEARAHRRDALETCVAAGARAWTERIGDPIS